MRGLNTNKHFLKLFKRHSIACDFFEIKKNEFGEVEDDEKVCTLDGVFYEETSRVNLDINVNGSSITKTYKTFMVLKNDESTKALASVYCILKGTKYEIIEIKNEGEMDLYYTFRLKVCK